MKIRRSRNNRKRRWKLVIHIKIRTNDCPVSLSSEPRFYAFHKYLLAFIWLYFLFVFLCFNFFFFLFIFISGHSLHFTVSQHLIEYGTVTMNVYGKWERIITKILFEDEQNFNTNKIEVFNFVLKICRIVKQKNQVQLPPVNRFFLMDFYSFGMKINELYLILWYDTLFVDPIQTITFLPGLPFHQIYRLKVECAKKISPFHRNNGIIHCIMVSSGMVLTIKLLWAFNIVISFNLSYRHPQTSCSGATCRYFLLSHFFFLLVAHSLETGAIKQPDRNSIRFFCVDLTHNME